MDKKYKNSNLLEPPEILGQLIEEVFVDEHTIRTSEFLLIGLQGVGDQEWSRRLELVGWEDHIDPEFRLFGGRLVLSQEHRDTYRFRQPKGNIEARDRFTLSYTYATEIGGLATKELFSYEIDPNQPVDDEDRATKILKAHLLRKGQKKVHAVPG